MTDQTNNPRSIGSLPQGHQPAPSKITGSNPTGRPGDGASVMTLRPAELEDLDDILRILSDGKALQRAQGFVQWVDGFPDPAEILQDLRARKGWMVLVDQQIAGYVYIDTQEPAYTQPTAQWTTREPYVVLHRVALAREYAGQGFGRPMLETCEQWARERGMASLRIDTMTANTRMQHLLREAGWTECGYVMYPFGHRMVFEKPLQTAAVSA